MRWLKAVSFWVTEQLWGSSPHPRNLNGDNMDYKSKFDTALSDLMQYEKLKNHLEDGRVSSEKMYPILERISKSSADLVVCLASINAKTRAFLDQDIVQREIANGVEVLAKYEDILGDYKWLT